MATVSPTPGLMQAVRDCRQRYLKYLLENSPQLIHTKDATGQNVLMAALHIVDPKKRKWAFKYLVARGANCLHVDKATGRNVLMWSCHHDRTEEVDFLLDMCHGDINLQKRDVYGKCVLHYAVAADNLRVLKTLTKLFSKYCLSVDVADNMGFTPYMQAIRSGHYECAHVLKTEGLASPYKFDTTSYTNVHEWDRIGAIERQSQEDEALQQKISMYKMLGRLPQLLRSNYDIQNVKIVESSLDKKLLHSDEKGKDPTKKKSRRHTAPPALGGEMMLPYNALPPLQKGQEPSSKFDQDHKVASKKRFRSLETVTDKKLPPILERAESVKSFPTVSKQQKAAPIGNAMTHAVPQPVFMEGMPPILLKNPDYSLTRPPKLDKKHPGIVNRLHVIMDMLADCSSTAYRKPAIVIKPESRKEQALKNLRRQKSNFSTIAKMTVGAISMAKKMHRRSHGSDSSTDSARRSRSRKVGHIRAPSLNKLEHAIQT